MLQFRKFVPAMLLVLFMLTVNYAIARAGGGGGFGSSSGGSDDDGGVLEILWYIFIFIPFPWNLIVCAVVLAGAFIVGKRVKAKGKT